MDKRVRNIIIWTGIGLAVRLALMPFTMHGQDLIFINYFPAQFVKSGIWDPYAFIRAHFPYFHYSYYGPVLFVIVSAVDFIFIKLLNWAPLAKMLELAIPLVFREGVSTIDYLRLFSGLPRAELFANLFLMKTPYLMFDFLIAAILFKFFVSGRTGLASYKMWMLNIIVLHSAYAIGQFDLIPAFFIFAAYLAALRGRPYLAVASLCLGGAAKLVPYVLVLPTCLLLGQDWKNRLSLAAAAAAVSIFIYLPFCVFSNCAVLDFFLLGTVKQYPGAAKWLLGGVFICAYTYILMSAVKDSRAEGRGEKLLYYYAALIFLIYAVTPIAFRYLVFVTPFLALIIPGRKRFGIFVAAAVLMLAFLRLNLRELLFGLFSPLAPAFFLGLPTPQELLGRIMNIEFIYKILARIVMAAFFICAWWCWRMKRTLGGITSD